MTEFNVYMVIDEDGNHAVGTTRSGAMEAYDSDIGGDLVELAYRVVMVPVMASVPRLVTLSAVTVADDTE